MKMSHLVVLMIILLRLSRRFEKLIRKINLLLMHEKGSFAEKAFSHAQHHGGREEAKAERGVQRKTNRALVSGHLRSLLFHRHIDLAHSADRAQGAFQTVDQASRHGHMTTQNRGQWRLVGWIKAKVKFYGSIVPFRKHKCTAVHQRSRPFPYDLILIPKCVHGNYLRWLYFLTSCTEIFEKEKVETLSLNIDNNCCW